MHGQPGPVDAVAEAPGTAVATAPNPRELAASRKAPRGRHSGDVGEILEGIIVAEASQKMDRTAWFVLLVAASAVIAQYVMLLNASVKIPPGEVRCLPRKEVVLASRALGMTVVMAVSSPLQEWTRQDCVQSTKGGKLSGSNRDCQMGQGPFCTREVRLLNLAGGSHDVSLRYRGYFFDHWFGFCMQESCTPCEDGGCRACSATEVGNCQFVESVGPYCRFDVPEGSERDFPGVGKLDMQGRRFEVQRCRVCCSASAN